MKISKDENSYTELKKPSNISCDFCEKQFKNRYDSILHNASHIIIPLLKECIHHCDKCNKYFTTIEDYKVHDKSEHHTKIIIGKKRLSNKIDEIVSNIKVENEFDQDINEKISDIKNGIREPLWKKLKYEEDMSISNGLIKDLVTECKVNVQLFDPPWLMPTMKMYKEFKNPNNGLNGIDYTNNGTCSNVNQMITSDVSYSSVSYSSLMKPGIYQCKFCLVAFANRYSLIKHEKCHIKISIGRPLLCIYCDRYIAGDHYNLHSHIQKKHPNNKTRKHKTRLCKRCGLKFRKYRRHVANYHVNDCLACGMECNDSEQNADMLRHVATCRKVDDATKMIEVCDLCYSFLKNKINLNYYFMGTTKSELGVRRSCHNCGKKHFDLKMVKRIRGYRAEYKPRRSKTNEDRLKNIQHRLQRLKLLNKYYFRCFILYNT